MISTYNQLTLSKGDYASIIWVGPIQSAEGPQSSAAARMFHFLYKEELKLKTRLLLMF